ILQQGWQQDSQQEPQVLPQPPPPPQHPPDPNAPPMGAEATEPTAGAAVVAAAAGAGSAPANHAVVTSKNAAFTRVILRWSLTSAEGHRTLAGSDPLRQNWRP